jgi:hypothetical protein
MDELSNLDGDGGESLSAGFWGDLRPESSLSVLANSIFVKGIFCSPFG